MDMFTALMEWTVGTLPVLLVLNSSELVDFVITPTKCSAPHPARALCNYMHKGRLGLKKNP